MADARGSRPDIPVLVGAAAMLAVAMGIRQTLGLFMQPITRDIAITVSEFALALSVQNLGWGLLQPLVGALVMRFGFRPILVGGAVAYLAALAALAAAQGAASVMLGAGLLCGAALACTGSAMAQATAARAAPPALRSIVLGLVIAVGSLGALVAAPLAQTTTGAFGWRWGMAALLLLATLLLPAA
jgi:MFS family permease